MSSEGKQKMIKLNDLAIEQFNENYPILDDPALNQWRKIRTFFSRTWAEGNKEETILRVGAFSVKLSPSFLSCLRLRAR